MTRPTKVTLLWANVHFFRLSVRPEFLMASRKRSKCDRWSDHDIEWTAMSSMKGSANALMGSRIRDTKRMKLLPTDFRPKGSRLNWNNPESDMNAEAGRDSSRRGTCQY